jgi:hypothetical protein
MRADRKKPKVVPARKPIAKATNDIAHGVSKSGARISCACRPIICSYAPARRRGDEIGARVVAAICFSTISLLGREQPLRFSHSVEKFGKAGKL